MHIVFGVRLDLLLKHGWNGDMFAAFGFKEWRKSLAVLYWSVITLRG